MTEGNKQIVKCPGFQPIFGGKCAHYFSNAEKYNMDNNCRTYGLNKCDPTTGELEGRHHPESLR